MELNERFTKLPESAAAGRAWQVRLARQVLLDGPPATPRTVLGLDCAGPPRGQPGTIRAAAVVVEPGGEVLEERVADVPEGFPYLPGLLALREAPALLAVLRRIESPVDAIFVDGHGVLHPRRFGLACLVGLASGLPTVGVAKQSFGAHYDEPAPEPGASAPLRLGGELLGFAVRTRRGSRPVHVSPGHLVSAPTAVTWVLAFGGKYRLPDPTHLADRLAGGAR